MPTRGPVCSRLGSAPTSIQCILLVPAFAQRTARVQIKRWIDKTRWLGPGHITSWVRMSAPEYHTSTLTHARVALRNTAATVPSRGYVCHRCRAYVPLVACRSGEHLRGPIVAAESLNYIHLCSIYMLLIWPSLNKIYGEDSMFCGSANWRLTREASRQVFASSVKRSRDPSQARSLVNWNYLQTKPCVSLNIAYCLFSSFCFKL